MSEPPPESPPEAAPEATPRFFPHGFACPSCAYDMSHATNPQCPECGMVLVEHAAVGLVREMTEAERAFARTAIGRIGRRDLLLAMHTQVWRRFGILVLVAGVPALLYAMFQMGNHNASFPGQLLVGAAWSYAGLLLVYVGLMAWTFAGFHRTVRRLRQQQDADLERGIVEEWWMETSHVLTIDGHSPIRHYLRGSDGRVMGVRADASAWISPQMGGRIGLAMLPRTRVSVGLRADGPPMAAVVRSLGEGVVPRRDATSWCTPIVFFKNEAEALRGANPFAGASVPAGACTPGPQPKPGG
ncbi:MAG: hypothetical protein ACIAS6_00505 [Phycisphaerales bacterium JB060]